MPLAAAESLERLKLVAFYAPAPRHAAAQHCEAPDVLHAQAGLLMVLGKELHGAALFPAHA